MHMKICHIETGLGYGNQISVPTKNMDWYGMQENGLVLCSSEV